jgi:predicted alternative tryptophan synthase beta-subunit
MNIENVILTKEMESKLALFTAIKPVDFFDYTPAVFKEAYPDNPELWPVFKCKSVKMSTIMNNDAVSIGGLKYHCFKNGVKSWTNPKNVLGVDFKQEYVSNGVLTDDGACNFSAPLISEIGLEIHAKSTISVTEEISL